MRSRVLFFGPLPPYESGIAQHSSHFVTALRALDVEVTAVTWAVQYPPLIYRGTTRRLPRDQHESDSLVWWNPVTWAAVRRSAADHDGVIFPYVTPFHALQQHAISSGARRSLAIVHNAVPHEWMPGHRAITRWTLDGCDALLIHGDQVRNELVNMGISAETVQAPMPSVASIVPSPLPRSDIPMLLIFGHVRSYKGIDVALRAVRHLADRGRIVHLTVVGRFWTPTAATLDLVRDLGLERLVDIRDEYISEAELETHLSKSSLVLAPYIDHTLSAVVPTALAAGRPVVVSSVDGVLQQVKPGVNAVAVRPRDPLDLARGIEEALANLDALAEGAITGLPTWRDVALKAAAALQLVGTKGD